MHTRRNLEAFVWSVGRACLLAAAGALLLAGCVAQADTALQANATAAAAGLADCTTALEQQAADARVCANELAALQDKLKAALAPTAAPEPTPAPTKTPEPSVPDKPEQTDPMKLALAPGVEIELVRVPAGEFTMGADDGDLFAKPGEKPQRSVYLDEYLIGKTEVTVAQFRVFMLASGYKFLGKKALPEGRDDYPMDNANPDDAQAFVEWLSQWTGRKVTLPTEAQWEKAARGPTGDRIYPWGNEFLNCNYANVALCKGDVMPVGSYPLGVSPYGALDMTGNAWEICADLYDEKYYQYAPDRNPVNTEKGLDQVMRGGSATMDWDYARTSFRWMYDWDLFSASMAFKDSVGLRVVVEP